MPAILTLKSQKNSPSIYSKAGIFPSKILSYAMYVFKGICNPARKKCSTAQGIAHHRAGGKGCCGAPWKTSRQEFNIGHWEKGN